MGQLALATRRLTAGWILAASFAWAGCFGGSQPSPLPDLHGATRVVVTRSGAVHEFRHPGDSLRIAMIADALQAFPNGWRPTSNRPPAPFFGAAFMDDSTLIAVLWIGSRSISGYSRGEHLARRVSRTDELQLRALLDPTTVIGVISNQRPDAPQN